MVNIYLPFTKPEEIYNATAYQQFFDKYQYLSRFEDALAVKGLYGSFPGALWNGGRPPSREMRYDEEKIKTYIDFLNINSIECRMTFTNCLLEEKHLNDPYCNMILDLLDNGQGNKIIINSQILEDYILEKHPNLGLISSITKGNDFDTFVENIKKPQYDLVVCYSKKNILDYIENNIPIEQRDRIEVMLNSGCGYCKNAIKHYELESYNNLYNDKKTLTCYRSLPSYNPDTDFSPEEEIDFNVSHLEKLHLTNLKFQGRNVIPARLSKDVIDNLFKSKGENLYEDLEKRLVIK